MSEELPKVFIGKKPSGRYVAYALSLLTSNSGVIIEARGNNIPKAIRVAHYVMRIQQNLKLGVEVGCDTLKVEGKEVFSPFIKLLLEKVDAHKRKEGG